MVIKNASFTGPSLIQTLPLPHFDDTLGELSSVKVSYTIELRPYLELPFSVPCLPEPGGISTCSERKALHCRGQ